MQLPSRLSTVFLVVVVLAILAFGLTPIDDFSNRAHRLKSQPGIRFQKYGMVYSATLPVLNTDAFSIEIAFKPENPLYGVFSHILVLHGGDDSSQLLIGQWRTWIIIMNGDDYSNRQKRPRIVLNTAGSPLKKMILTVISSPTGGTRLYLNGNLIRRNKELILTLPGPGNDKVRMVVGNSVYGRHPWVGVIYGLAFYGRNISDEKARKHHQMWWEGKRLQFARQADPDLLYLFDDPDHRRLIDHSGGGHHLLIPDRIENLNRQFLTIKSGGYRVSTNLRKDVIINLVGFLPFGFFLGLALFNQQGIAPRYVLLCVLFSGFCLSLSIEIVQAWLPSRHSSLLDLVFNTLGTGIGVLSAMRFSNV